MLLVSSIWSGFFSLCLLFLWLVFCETGVQVDQSYMMKWLLLLEWWLVCWLGLLVDFWGSGNQMVSLHSCVKAPPCSFDVSLVR